CQSEQMAGPLAGLDVLERHVVHRLSIRERMADVFEHLQASRPDIQLVRAAANRLHQLARLGERAVTGSEAGHGVGQDVGTRPAGSSSSPERGTSRLKRIVRNVSPGGPSRSMLWPNVFWRMRSWLMRSRSRSAVTSWARSWKRFDSASRLPSSATSACPSQARSVVDSPGPAPEYRYAAMHRADCPLTR